MTVITAASNQLGRQLTGSALLVATVVEAAGVASLDATILFVSAAGVVDFAPSDIVDVVVLAAVVYDDDNRRAHAQKIHTRSGRE